MVLWYCFMGYLTLKTPLRLSILTLLVIEFGFLRLPKGVAGLFSSTLRLPTASPSKVGKGSSVIRAVFGYPRK